MAALAHPASLDDALRRLAEPDARPIGGGVAILLAARFGRPPVGRFVAVSRLAALRGADVDPATGELVVGGGLTLAQVAASTAVRERAPLLAAAARRAASAAIRTVGTLAGNLVAAPGASDLAAAAVVLGASLEIRSLRGRRTVPVLELGLDAVEPDELVCALRVPPSGGAGWSLQRLQTQGRADRPAASVALLARVVDGRIGDARVAATFIGDRPIALPEVAAALSGASLGDVANRRLDEQVERAARSGIDRAVAGGVTLVDDVRGSAGYRREVTGVLAGRAAADAARAFG